MVKEDALYGIFAESSEDEGAGIRSSKVRSKRNDWTKAPTFTTGDKPVKLDDPMPVDDDQQRDPDTSGEDSEAVLVRMMNLKPKMKSKNTLMFLNPQSSISPGTRWYWYCLR